MVAGEASGDYLAAGLIRALKEKVPDLEVEGVGGPRMAREGARILFPMDTISIMGVDGLARGLHRILSIRRSLREHFRRHPPDAFVGVDVPDFNLGLERRLRRAGITTIHYVSPTVWAWRAYRIRKIRRAVDLMLVLFPFEADYYRERGVPARFVGHPLADEVPERIDRDSARRALGLGSDCGPVVALMPGSRVSELERLGRVFVDVAAALERRHRVVLLAPFISRATLEHFRALLAEQAPELTVHLLEDRSSQVLAASDLALLASGTAALEAALHQVPMVVTYKVSWFTSVMVRIFARVEHFSMPNHLLDEPVAPELMQARASVAEICAQMERYLGDEALRRDTERRLEAVPRMLRRGASERAAQAVLETAPARG